MFSNLDTGTKNNSTFTKDVASATKLLSSNAFVGYLQQEIYERSAMIQSGLLQQDARLNGITGVIAEMPFAAPLNYIEEQVNSSGEWGLNDSGYYSIQKQRASTQYAPIVTRGAAFGMDDLSQIQTGFDALANIRSQLATDMNRKITKKIISQLTGVLTGPLAAHSITAAAELTANDVLAGKALLGERGDDLDILIVHPDVKQHLIALGMTVFQGSPGGTVTYATQGVGVTQADIGYFAGFRVISDSQVPVDLVTSPNEPIYSCYLAASGLVRTGSQFPILIETERNILSLQDTLAVTYNRCDHIVGTSWIAGAFASDPSNDELADGANWYAAYQDTRLIPLVEVKAKSTFKGLLIDEDKRFAKHPAVVAKGDLTTVPDGAAAGTDGEGLAGASAPVAAKPATTKATKKD